MMSDKRHPSDLTDEEWTVVEKCLRLEEEIGAGRPLEVDLRRVRDAILYLNKTGCQWAYLPHDFPPRTTVNYHPFLMPWRSCKKPRKRLKCCPAVGWWNVPWPG